MAGKKQHDLPRLLLRGFAEVEGETESVWLFRKDAVPKTVSIQDVGHSKFFYDKPGPGTLDAFITDKENEYGAFVARLRRERRLNSSDKETLVEFVHSLVLRTRNLRDIMTRGVSSMLNELQPTFTDAEAARRQLLKEQRKNTPMWDKALTNYVRAKYGNLPRRQEKYVKKRENESFRRWLIHGAEAHIQQQVKLNKQEFSQAFEQLGEMTKTSHNSALREFLQPSTDTISPRYDRYRRLCWQVWSFERGSLILGDVTVLQFERRAGKFSPAFDGDKGDIILLPLSHDLLVIGTTEGTEELPSLDKINYASAKLSQNFFVALQNSEREKVYQGLLGRDTFRAPKILAS